MLILAGVTIAALTGSDSAPAKANEAAQKNDIGTAKDDVQLAVTNAITDAYQTAYVETGVSAGSASTTVGTEVIKAVAQKYQTNNQIGKATIEVTGFGTIANVTGNATVSISTTDFIVEGTIYKDGGNLTWGEIEENKPGIRFDVSSPIEVEEGAEQEVTATLKQFTADKVTWTSDSAKATVTADATDSKKAKIKGITKTGDAEKVTITATAGGYSATIEVKIIEEKIGLLSEQPRNTVLSSSKKTKLKDDKNNIIVIPQNFKILNADDGTKLNNVTEGIIIADSNDNEFVWVPVGENITNSKGDTVNIPLTRENASGYTEYIKNQGSSCPNTKAIDIGEFKNSVAANKGFYIARYEAGIDGTTDYWKLAGFQYNSTKKVYEPTIEANVISTNGSVKPIIHSGYGVWNAVTQPQAATICQSMYTSGVTSDLMNSYAWNTAITFIQACGTNSSYATQKGKSKTSTSAPQTTGTNYLLYDTNGTTELTTENRNDIQCNIYDMAGNVREWTTESSPNSSYPCVSRGGRYDDTYTTSDRYIDSTSLTLSNLGFRPLLYL